MGEQSERNSQSVFAVFKEGVYRHECAGVFTTREQAEAVAEQFIRNERDNYHAYSVNEFELDAASSSAGGVVVEADPVTVIRRVEKPKWDAQYRPIDVPIILEVKRK